MRLARRKLRKTAASGRWPRRLARVAAALCAAILSLWGIERLYGWVAPFPVAQLDHAPASVVVTADDGTWLRVTATPEGDRRLPIALADVAKPMIDALLASEDRRFYEHSGVDWRAVGRATIGNVARGKVTSGASTISMQLARLVEPRARTLFAKSHEMVRARQVERIKPKSEVLEGYLNLVPFSGNVRGVEAASQLWFGKRARALDLAEAATLVAMLPSPTRRSPTRAPDALLAARNRVLEKMRAERVITDAEAARAGAAPLTAEKHTFPYLAQDACELALAGAPGAIIGNDFGPPPQSARSARIVSTAVDLQLQQRLEDRVLRENATGVDGVAFVVLDRSSGLLRAAVGSHHPTSPSLNAAICARPAGSTLKPFLYALAQETGAASLDDLLQDAPGDWSGYAPLNFEKTFAGNVRSLDALRDSKNLPAVRLLQSLGVDRFRDLLESLGLSTREVPLGLDLALGTLPVTPLALARAYAKAFGPQELPGLRRSTRDAILQALTRPLPAGAASGARPTLAWKSGTSSNRRDAWCVGITDRHILCVWLGNLDGRGDPNLVGGRTAAGWLAELVFAARDCPRFPG
ncbi:MAG: transglycosylase domain-containing protein [Planctomycetes bacterium]|nr:transglycosylase domain-containing protein [Planctomycetota bacterium]